MEHARVTFQPTVTQMSSQFGDKLELITSWHLRMTSTNVTCSVCECVCVVHVWVERIQFDQAVQLTI